MKVVLNSAYLPNLLYFRYLLAADEVLMEKNSHYQKQSYRNRAEIYGANGKLNLIIPLVRRNGRTVISNVEMDSTQRWKYIHWKSLESAYRSSPYFEYYESHFSPIYKNEEENLFDWNLALIRKTMSLLKIDKEISFTEKYEKNYEGYIDLRDEIHPKKQHIPETNFERYIQVFEEKAGYIPNLSIVDLLFNEGPAAVNYLQSGIQLH